MLSIFADRSLKPERIIEVRELQIALGLVAAGEGVSIVPKSLYGMLRNDIHFMPIYDANAVSPVIMSMRQHDHSQNLGKLLDIIYILYDQAGVAYTREQI